MTFFTKQTHNMDISKIFLNIETWTYYPIAYFKLFFTVFIRLNYVICPVYSKHNYRKTYQVVSKRKSRFAYGIKDKSLSFELHSSRAKYKEAKFKASGGCNFNIADRNCRVNLSGKPSVMHNLLNVSSSSYQIKLCFFCLVNSSLTYTRQWPSPWQKEIHHIHSS